MAEAPVTLEVETEDTTKTATQAPSPMAETPVTLEVETTETTKAAEELDTASALPVSAIQGEPVVVSPDDVAASTPIVGAPKDEVAEPTVEATPVPQVIVEEGSKRNDGLSDNLLIAGAGLTSAALIGMFSILIIKPHITNKSQAAVSTR